MASRSPGNAMMTAIYIALLALIWLAPSTGAYADELPKEFLGKYCWITHGGWFLRDENNRCFDAEGKMKNDTALEIKPDAYARWEAGCDFVSIKVKWDPEIVAATKSPLGGYAAYIVGKCRLYGEKWKERLKIYWSKGYLRFH